MYRWIVCSIVSQRMREALACMGLPHAIDGRYDKWVDLILVVAISTAVMYLLRWIIGKLLSYILAHKRGALVEKLYHSHLVSRALWLLPTLSIHLVLSLSFSGGLYTALSRLCSVAIVAIATLIINTVIGLLWETFYERSSLRNRPMKGILQIIQGILIALGVIVSVSILINRSPTVLITGLGAFAAVLMLIFKDSILGFVAGIQLVQYDMVRNGDWVTIPGTIVDGVITDVSLNTVKVQNYDNTLIMLPPYTLISQPIQNWRGMKESGGRRIMKSIIIDLNSIQFCTQALLDKLSQQPIIGEFVSGSNITPYDPDKDATPDAVTSSIAETNMGLFRRYMVHYLKSHPDIQHDGYTLIVRLLEPDANGIPLQIYCFTNTTHWESYEIIQSQITEYVTAILPLFGLYPFQNASWRDYIAQSLVAQGYKPQGFDV